MSLYNIMNGVNPATFFILPMLGEKRYDDYPRFRDCYVELDKENPEIHVYTRVGGDNRNQGYGEEELQNHPNFLEDFDDDFDRTFATYCFSVPDEFKRDFELIIANKLPETSEAYKKRLYMVYPKLKETFDSIFGNSAA